MNRRILTLSLLIAALSLATCWVPVPPALAQASSSTTRLVMPVSDMMFNPCAGEFVVFSGQAVAIVHFTMDANGRTHLELVTDLQGVSGVGLVSGKKYQVTGMGSISIDSSSSPPFEFTNVISSRLIGQGPGNNSLLHVTTHTTVNANGVVTASVVDISIECR